MNPLASFDATPLVPSLGQGIGSVTFSEAMNPNQIFGEGKMHTSEHRQLIGRASRGQVVPLKPKEAQPTSSGIPRSVIFTQRVRRSNR